MNKTKTYYQPLIDYGDNRTSNWQLPEGLFSFQAFASIEDCEDWLDNHGYADEYMLQEYHDEDIEGVTIIDGEGNVLEINEE